MEDNYSLFRINKRGMLEQCFIKYSSSKIYGKLEECKVTKKELETYFPDTTYLILKVFVEE